MKRLAVMMLLAIAPHTAHAAMVCADLFQSTSAQESVTYRSLHPLITDDHLKQIALAKTEFDEVIFKGFSKPQELTIAAGLSVISHNDFFKKTVTFSFDEASYLFRTMPENAPAFTPKTPLIFNGKALLLHEYSHAVLAPYYLQYIPGYRDFQKTVQGYLAEGFSYNQVRRKFEQKPELFKTIRPDIITEPYDEFLADLAMVLFFDDPAIPGRTVMTYGYASEIGRLHAHLKALIDASIRFRNFDVRYRYRCMSCVAREIEDDPHILLGPARSATWEKYQSVRANVPRDVFFQKIVSITVHIIASRVQRENHVLTFANVISPLGPYETVLDFNNELISAIQAARF